MREHGSVTHEPVRIREVQDFWDANPCGSRTSDEPTRRAYFCDVAEKRYRLEPHIPELGRFRDQAGRDVLELGCGLGTDGRQFAEGGASYVGADLSRRSIALAKEQFGVFGLRQRFVAVNGEELPFAAESFDHVYSFGVIHHSPDTERIVGEIQRVLRPGGTFCVMVYNRTSINYYVQILFLRRVLRWLLFSERGARGLARLTGFDERLLLRHRALLRQRMTKEEWISANTDGPDCPLAKVYGRREAMALFRGFQDVRTEVRHFNRAHWPGLGRIAPEWLGAWLGRKFGWHRMIYGKKPATRSPGLS
jgi:ubiquinone/menaquinone biosynthesis C-methylase UbiE